MSARHGGDLRQLASSAGLDRDAIVDFSASVNPLGPPDSLRPVVARVLDRVIQYPNPYCEELVAVLAARYGVAAERIVVGNGSSEILYATARAVDARRALIPVPGYSDYASAAQAAGRPVVFLPLPAGDDFRLNWDQLAHAVRDGDLAFLGQPNNPTGVTFDPDRLLAFAASHASVTFVIDEAFIDFVEGHRSLLGCSGDNVIVVRSLTKFFAIPGLRLGFAVGSPGTIAAVKSQIPPWSVNVLAQELGPVFLADEAYARRTIDCVRAERQHLARRLAELPGLHVYPGEANYLLVRADREDLTAHDLAERLLQEAIAIRTFTPEEHLDNRHFRVAVRMGEENERLVEALGSLLSGSPLPLAGEGLGVRVDCGKLRPHPLPLSHRMGEGSCLAPSHLPPSHLAPSHLGPSHLAPSHLTPPYQPAFRWSPACRRAPALMIQGTSSNAGKSVLVAGLCRILLQDGFRVAPFKSQNMSLNSFVTRDGGEMGRAQVVQAQACRLEPDVRMNPILLKPNSDTGCQVIVRGQPAGNMRVAEYVRYKPEAFAAAKECYDSLASQFDAVILEGAGSPGEVNLKSHDIVNMRMAEYAHAPVLVVGDIDRGGVFASFVGTMEVLSAWERRLVHGWIVNRFRGDASLLDDALRYTLDHTGRPVLGVVPYLADLNLPEEDSVSFKCGDLDRPGTAGQETVTIAVVDLPHISNFTDFDSFRVESDVCVQIVRSVADLDQPDAVILPGSKNTLADLDYLRRSGLAQRILHLARESMTEIVGICGGLQMLGRTIRDPDRIESEAVQSDGLGLLPAETVLATEKTLVRTAARHGPSGLDVVGYEIHHGLTSSDRAVPLLTRADGEVVGVASDDGRVWGTYLHGVFDADPFRRWFLDRLRVRRGHEPVGRVIGRYDIEAAIDRLADAVRRSVRMEEIYRRMGLC
jgi:cobyric acid synthase CobQ/L-threonine-O-3-phosphate decarboxylase